MPPSAGEPVCDVVLELPFGTFTLNKIQPFAVVLCLDEGLYVRRASANVELLGCPAPALLGKKIDELVEDASHVRAFAEARGQPQPSAPFPLAFTVQGTLTRWDAFPTLRCGHVILECERAKREGPGYSVVDLSARLVAGVEALRGDLPEAELCAAAARAMASISGYDRVMIYKFMGDGHGHVVGEYLNDPGYDSYLDLHFPASDIPEEMRALFLRERSRMIVDAASRPAALVPEAVDARLAAATAGLKFRAPHACHAAYMQNMSTRASLTTAIVVGAPPPPPAATPEEEAEARGVAREELWGLAVGHHRTPREVGFEVRSAVLVVAHSLSVALRASREREERAGEARVSAMQAALIRSAAEGRFLAALQERDSHVSRRLDPALARPAAWAPTPSTGPGDTLPPPARAQLVEATGCAIVASGSASLSGETPSEAECLALFPALSASTMDVVASWDCLQRIHPPAEKYAAAASGALVAFLSGRRDAAVIWFRREWAHEVAWSGSSEELPYTAAQLRSSSGPEAQALRPRGSFAAWRQSVRGRCRPWGAGEAAAARSFLKTLRALEARIKGEAASKRSIEEELQSRDLLLCNLLPPKIMREMMKTHRVQSRLHRNVCILFADIVGLRLSLRLDEWAPGRPSLLQALGRAKAFLSKAPGGPPSLKPGAEAAAS
eukprot:tig00021037_g17417.t1